MARLLENYKEKIAPELMKSLEITNPMAVPRLEKMVVSMGTGSPVQDKNRLAAAAADLSVVTGQKAQTRRARTSVSNFKIRKGYDVGCCVTLRGKRMYEFLDRLINAAIPRTRDFRGLNPRSFDGRGNYSMGVPDQSIFAEIDISKTSYGHGMGITFVTSARDDLAARELLTRLGLPFRKTGQSQ